jgi:hypothetical protein
MKIQRYIPDSMYHVRTGTVTHVDLIPDADGEAVLFDDHVAELEQVNAERDALNALIELAGADIIFFHSQEYGPFIGPETPEIPQKVQFSVMVNDLFVPAADSEGFDISEAIPLRDVFRCDGWEGVVRWVQKKRDNMPLRPHIEKRVREKEIAARAAEKGPRNERLLS